MRNCIFYSLVLTLLFLIGSCKDSDDNKTDVYKRQLFKRFYEGDYRKFNTIGTGIGLSLTKDLVELHLSLIHI